MGRHTDLINRLWSDPADRNLAESFATHFGDMPGMESRIPALLQEAARPTEMSPDQSWAYLQDFARQIGTPPHAMAAFDGWFNSTSAEMAAAEPPAQQTPEQSIDKTPAQSTQPQPAAATPAPIPTAAPPQPAAAAPANIHDRIAEIETRHMRAAPGTPEYAAYWLGEAGQRMQAEYRDLVTARDILPAPTTLAAGAAASAASKPAPAPAAETAAPAA